MKILNKGIMPDGANIQIEEWSENYNFKPYGSTLAIYPVSKATHKGSYAPKEGDTYRFSFDFDSHSEAEKAFDDLIKGNKFPLDFHNNFSSKREYLNCI
ncbi:hypothetical protein [Siminovitchia fordii]|uniref:Uncharacterized protein n=1 Tax=Siminovitchia fordii TaxID=254759 RepID=A0ABQ4KCL2_9BACI|nr:hypothetical protein [Siminovitchia fordii]GIN22618.1 hypothetical protein J1TS3_37520 [Siminovitchia fordii]